MNHNDLKCFSEAYQIKALKATICELESEIEKLTRLINRQHLTKKWAKPIASQLDLLIVN